MIFEVIVNTEDPRATAVKINGVEEMRLTAFSIRQTAIAFPVITMSFYKKPAGIAKLYLRLKMKIRQWRRRKHIRELFKMFGNERDGNRIATSPLFGSARMQLSNCGAWFRKKAEETKECDQ